MRILVLSDTHIPFTGKKLPSKVIEEAKKSDLCIHAGDFVEYSVFEELASYVRTYGVCGNMDNSEVSEKLPYRQIIEIDKICIGVIHGRGAPRDLISFVNSNFRDQWNKIDIFIFGHSHSPLNKKIGDKIYFNPGSVMDKLFAPYNSYGILEIKVGEVNPKIVKLNI